MDDLKPKTVYQHDVAGRYLGDTLADASPLEAGVWLMPAMTVDVPPPAPWPEGTWPRWNGYTWEPTGVTNPLQAKQAEPTTSPVEKLRDFLLQHPDVAEMLNLGTA